MDGYIQSATEEGLAPPGKHTLSLFCQYAPYELSEGTWEGRREEIGANIIDTLGSAGKNVLIPTAGQHFSRSALQRAVPGPFEWDHALSRIAPGVSLSVIPAEAGIHG